MLVPIGDENPTRRVPLVNYAIIAANVLVFFAFAFRPGYERIVRTYTLGMIYSHELKQPHKAISWFQRADALEARARSGRGPGC